MFYDSVFIPRISTFLLQIELTLQRFTENGDDLTDPGALDSLETDTVAGMTSLNTLVVPDKKNSLSLQHQEQRF